MDRYAIVSVYDKEGLEPFVRGLVGLGYTILSTGGTAKFLTEKGIALRTVDDYTGFPEMLDGRVKTLHPKIHGGILARRERADDMRTLTEHSIGCIDLVVVNLYPFADKIRELEQTGEIAPDAYGHRSLVEFIDIGGPTMIRAAAKNFLHVAPVCDPGDYDRVLGELRAPGGLSKELRQRLAAKVFTTMSAYDGAIARYFSLSENIFDEQKQPVALAPVESIVVEKVQELRYGENPHQDAGLYRPVHIGHGAPAALWRVTQGKELSYNNLLDMYAALDLFCEISEGEGKLHAAVVIKHNNPCGVALASSALEAFRRARDCDPVSAFGGIIVVSGTVDGELAASITEGFVEVVVVQALTADAESVFAKKKNVRLVIGDFGGLRAWRRRRNLMVRNMFGDFLLQTSDRETAQARTAKVVTARKPDEAMLDDLDLAWRVSKHVKSNTIVVARDKVAIGIGAGQMSRVDAAKICLQRAESHGHTISGSVAASDAFLPFPDTLELLAAGGVVALVQPGGSIKDEDVVAAADRLNMVMLFTGERHFRH